MADSKPQYILIAEDLQRRIDAGELVPGDRLPTEAELAKRWNVSGSTVKDALKELRKNGRVSTRPREGSFVTGRVEPFVITLSKVELPGDLAGTGFGGGEGKAFEEEAALQGHSARTTRPAVAIRPATPLQIKELQIPTSETDEGLPQIVSRMQERFLGDTPNSLQTSYFSLKRALTAPLLLNAEDIEQGTVAYLHSLGLTQTWYKDVIDARQPTPDELAFFGLSKGSLAVLVHSRTAYDKDKLPFRLTVTVYASGRNEIRSFGGDVPAEFEPLGEP
ncbi:MAG: transcriptional regulator, GntR family [Actinomycetia bacterium]|nr:transcriptional regulator, GntR family [Actinomycetes bacterium]